MQIPLNQILITDRQRLSMDEDHIEQLMESFKDIGQVQAVLVAALPKNTPAIQLPNSFADPAIQQNFHYRIIAGATRCTAALRLNWTHIEAIIASDLLQTDAAKQKAEYVENALRRDLPWQDSCLAIARLNRILSNERALDGKNWTETMMAKFTGYSRTPIRYMLRVAEALSGEPRDEELWTCTGFTPAFQLLLSRIDQEAVREIERRQQALAAGNTNQPEETDLPDDEDGEETDQEEESDSSVDGYNSPSPEQGESMPVQCRIYGNVIPKRDMYSLAILYKPSTETNLSLLYTALKSPGYIVIIGVWSYQIDECTNAAKCNGFNVMPYQVIWDRQELQPRMMWPFTPNHSLCLILQKQTGEHKGLHPNPSASVVTSFPCSPDTTLPLAVVSHLVTALCPPGEPVLNPDCSAIIPLLELGHVPVWQESDLVKYTATKQLITDWYKANVPGCEVVE